MKIVDPTTGKTSYEKRRRRYDEFGHARELTFCTYHRYHFLESDRVRRWFIDSLACARQELAFDIWAYTIMPDHVHLLILPRGRTASVSGILRAIKEPVARRAIEYLRQHSPAWLQRLRVKEGSRIRHRFWQPGGGYDRNIVELETLQKVIEYIHANPVRRGLVQRVEDWEWSSARWYAGIRPVVLEMDRTISMMMQG